MIQKPSLVKMVSKLIPLILLLYSLLKLLFH
jgi:hypothetical protein